MGLKLLEVALALLSLAFIVAVAFALPYINIRNVGRVKTVGLDCDTESIDWGFVEPGENVSCVIALVPTGNVPITLALETANWVPSNASGYLALTWNYTGEALEAGVWLSVELCLHVDADVSGIDNFAFDVVVVATDV